MSKKYWDKKVNTTDSKDSWQEPFERESNVPAKAIQAIDTLLGFSGSWVGAYASPYSSIENGVRQVDAPSSNPNWRVSNLGRYGYPELNFIPYNYRTNAMGSKGGSLVGHPISFSIVGPTAKRLSHEWEVTTTTEIQLNSTLTLVEIYGDLSKLVDEGLYFVVSETGAERGGKVFVADSIYPKEKYGQSAKFEIFRVTFIDMATGRVQFDKPLDTFFDLVANARFEHLTFFKPYATRLVAVPDSGERGAEKKFLVVSPERAAYGDMNPIFNDPMFDSMARRGSAEEDGYLLPIPIPLKNLEGTLEKDGVKADGLGIWRIENLPAGHGLNGGELIHVTDVNLNNLEEEAPFNPNQCLGWFEVVEGVGNAIIVRRNIEIDANTGERIQEDLLFVNSVLNPTGTVQLKFSVHEPVSQIFEGEYNPDKVDSVRLTNLIDPNWVDRTTKRVADDTDGTLFAGAPAKADRSIFTTNTDGTTLADAGNLLDLGFRMVLFPAKEDGKGGDAIPDFSRPITSNEVIIDPSTTEKQTIDIDYSAGTVTLSHAPVVGGQILPDGIRGTDTNNKRGEVVLFACCVPYSMERGQTGTGISVTGGDLRLADHGEENISYASPLGQVVTCMIDRFITTFWQVVTNQKIPRNAYFTVVDKDFDPPSDFSHSSRKESIDRVPLGEGFFKQAQLQYVADTRNGKRYIYHLTNVMSSITLDENLHDLIIRKQNIEFTSLVKDNSYGSAYRSDTVRFAFADIEANVDGSITVFPTATKGPAQELRSLFPMGGSLDWGRVAFNKDTLRWTVGSPTHTNNKQYQIGLEVSRGKAYVTDYVRGSDSTLTRIVHGISSLTVESDNTQDTLTVQVKGQTGSEYARLLKGFIENPSLRPSLFGESLVSDDRTWTSETWDGHRLVIAVYDKVGKGNHNPTQWLSLQLSDNMPLNAIVAGINTFSNQLNGLDDIAVEFPNPINEGRVLLTERSFEVMPSLPYLLSEEITPANPFVAADKSRMFITVRSADPMYPERWATFPIQTDSANYSDPKEVAAFLNRSLYDRNYDYWVGDSLAQAGFYREKSGVSVNPYLQGAAVGVVTPLQPNDQFMEHCILFLAHDDNRHPSFDPATGAADPTHPDYNKVALFCGGRGAGVRLSDSPVVENNHPDYEGDISPLTNGFGVFVGYDALHNVLVEIAEDNGERNANLVAILGGDFQTAQYDEVVRCGLFYRDSPTGVSTDVQARTIPPASISPAVGTDPRWFAKCNEIFAPSDYGTITSARYLGSFTITDQKIDTDGSGNDYLELDLVSDKIEAYSDDVSRHLYNQPKDSWYNDIRWTHHQKSYAETDLTDANSTGVYRIWFNIVAQVVEATQCDASLSRPPKNVDYPILFSFTNYPNKPDTDFANLVGQGLRFNDKDDTFRFHGVALDSEHALLRANFTLDVFDPLNPIVTFTPYDFEMYPRPMGIHSGYRSTMSVQNQNTMPLDNEMGFQPNVTYVAGGYVELFSSDYRNAPSGISFGTSMRDIDGNDNESTFITHMEHGVWRMAGSDTSELYWGEETYRGNANLDEGLYSSDFKYSGVAGVRVSGDTQIWMKNARILNSGNQFTAAVIKEKDALASLAVGSLYDFELDFVLSTLERSRQGGLAELGGHSAFNVKGSQNTDGLVLQEAVVFLGLTSKDHEAFENFVLAGNLPSAMHSIYAQPSVRLREKEQFNYAQTIGETALIKNLEGKWLDLRLESKGLTIFDNPPYTFAQNVGRWRIVASPVLHSGTSLVSKLVNSAQTKSFVSCVALKVERWAKPSSGFRQSSIVWEDVDSNGSRDRMGYAWGIYANKDGFDAVFSAEVLETGGTPTGVPSSLRGMTVDPLALGKDHLPFTVVREPTGTMADGKLYGVFPHMTSNGIPKTIAFFTVPNGSEALIGNNCRGVIRSWEDTKLLSNKGENLTVDDQGRISFKMTRRLGRGIFLDGGLGVVHATGFRSNPRPVKQESVGGLQVFGTAGYPYTSTPNRTASVLVSNILDTTEFIDDVYVVSPKGKIVFEDARALSGLAARIKENYWASTSTFSEGTYDALLPYNMGGLMFRGSGGVSYSRPFSPLSSYASTTRQYLGKPVDSGLKGMGVPNYGRCVLLPKGAATQKGEGVPNYNGGFPSLGGVTPLDLPLYEFVQGSNHTLLDFGFNENSLIGCLGFHSSTASSVQPHAIMGTGDAHEANSGTLTNSSATAYSRYSAPYSATEQITLMEGMIVEDVTNGTFYTIGEIGRNWIESQYTSNGMYYTGSTGEGSRPSVQGSRVVVNSGGQESIIFDLNPLVGHQNSLGDPCHGFGDRTDTFTDHDSTTSYNGAYTSSDRTHVRTPVIGHKLRVIPNVEFVPVLGEHGVDGGLLPPPANREYADALFYSISHAFKQSNANNGAGDIGKFLYLSGTDCYNYTGWWVIIDVIEDYVVQGESTEHPTYSTLRCDVALLRKLHRNEGRAGDADTNKGALPLEHRSPILRMTGSPHLKDINAGSPQWFDGNNCTDMILIFKEYDGTTVNLTVPAAFFAGLTLAGTVAALNADPLYNGQGTFGVANFIKWQFEGTDDLHGAITVTLDRSLSPIARLLWERFVGHYATIYGYFSPNNTIINNTTGTPSIPQKLGQSGFFSYPGVNSAVDRGAGDRNNSAIMFGTDNFQTYSAARGIRWIFSHPLTEENVGSYLHLTRPQKRFFDRDTVGFANPTADGANPQWISRYQTESDLLANELILKTDLFRVNRCPSTKQLVIGGDCETATRSMTISQSPTNTFVYSPLGLDYGFWQDTNQHDYQDISLYNTATVKPYLVRPLREPTQYALQPIAREKIIAVNPSSGESNTYLMMSPRIRIQTIEYFMDTTGVVRVENHYVITCGDGTTVDGEFHPPKDDLSVGTPIIFRDTGLAGLDGSVGYVLGFEDVQLFSSAGPNPLLTNKVRVKVFTPTYNVLLATQTVALPEAYVAVTEGLRPLSVNGVDMSKPFKLRSASDLMVGNTVSSYATNYAPLTDAEYQWTPASKWWEVQVPYAQLGWDHPLDEVQKAQTTETPSVLRFDLTEAYTQAQQSGAGIGSAIEEKRPVGVRLNRLWVNFGLWGNPSQVGLSAEHDWSVTPALRWKGANPSRSVQAITFNLKVEIPSKKLNPDPRLGSGLLPFGGRAPTISSHVNVDTPAVSGDKDVQNLTTNTYDIPLYVNREAGELSPNITDRFRSQGVNNFTSADWRVGDAEHGLGIGSTADASTFYDITTDPTGAGKFVSNASTVAVWGTIDSYAFGSTVAGNPRHGLVQCSLSPRQSMVAVNPFVGSRGLSPSFNWAEFDDDALKSLERSLHKNSLNGLTIAHIASYAPPPTITSSTYTHLCPHSFTVALTPIGDYFEVDKLLDYGVGDFVSPSGDVGSLGYTMKPDRNRRFKVGNWLDSIIQEHDLEGLSGSMLPEGAKVWLEITVPQTRQTYGTGTDTPTERTANGTWVGQVLCSFEVETADGTALTKDVNLLSDE